MSQIFLTLWTTPDGSSSSVGVDRDAAYSMTEKEFRRFYREHVHGASRREAREWARQQVALRGNGERH